MTLWHLELLRLVRTHRWTILFGVYLFFAVIGPLTARYFAEIMGSFGGELTIVAPDPRPIDGLAQFLSNATQVGLLAVVIVAAGPLAVDARPELAAFLRTRVARARDLLLPRYVVVTVAAILALTLGTALAWALTGALIGALPAGAVIGGTALGALYLGFAVAVVAAVAGFTRTTTGAVFGALLLLLALPLVGLVPAIEPWLPSRLVGAPIGLVEGMPAADFVRSIAVTLATTAGLLVLAVRRFARREL